MKTYIHPCDHEYSFEVIADNGRTMFNSEYHYYCVSDTYPTYKTASSAHMAAKDVIKKAPYLKYAIDEMSEVMYGDVSAERMLVNHYISLLQLLKKEAKESKGSEREEDEVFNSIDGVIEEIKRVIEKIEDKDDKKSLGQLMNQFVGLNRKYFPGKKRKESPQQSQQPQQPQQPQKTASNVDKDAMLEYVLDNYLKKIYDVIGDQNKSWDGYVDKDKREICLSDCRDGSKVLSLKVNDNFNISLIRPLGKLAKECPLHSLEFYQKYWKPIVEEIGHYYFDDFDSLFVNGHDEQILPDIPPKDESRICELSCYSPKQKGKTIVNLSLSKDTWGFEKDNKTNTKTASYVSKYNEDELKNRIVKCIDPNLESIYNRTGVVIQVITQSNGLEIDVDFGRGIDVVRLIESQIEIIDV